MNCRLDMRLDVLAVVLDSNHVSEAHDLSRTKNHAAEF